MLNLIYKRLSLWMWAIALSLLSACTVYSEDIPKIFDWQTFADTSVPGVTPVPHALDLGYNHDWQGLYANQAANNKIIGLMLKVRTGPYDGSYNPNALSTVMDYINTNGYYLDFVFADFEGTTRDLNCQSMVNQVRTHANSSINNAYIGNYGDSATSYDYADCQASFDRTARHDFYVNSGMNVSMPITYPYSAYRNHFVNPSNKFGSNICISIPQALFWAPLERYSAAKRELPPGHKIIPWMGYFVQIYYSDGTPYLAPPPSKEECRSLLQHIRLRGADGYYTWGSTDGDIEPPVYTSRTEYRDDMYANAWRPLDWFFALPGKSEILNFTTNKTGGIEWSGMRRGNHCLFIFSNYTTSAVTVNLPTTIENLPATSPIIAAADTEGTGSSLLMDYVIGPKSYWKLEGNANDSMAAGTNGAITGTTTVTGKTGNALSFNGTSDGISFGDVLDLGLDDRSISLWFKTTTSDANYRVLLSKGYAATTNHHAIFLLNGKIYCIMKISGVYRNINTGVTANDGNWHHIAVTIQRNDKMKLYLDGSLKSQVDISADENVDAQDIYGFYLGRSNIGQYFEGSIDEVKIFTSVISEKEIFDEYASCALSVRLDERQGAVAHDDTIVPHNGTVVGAITEDGKSGGALTFNGVSDGVSFGDVLDLGLNDRSISLWFKTTTSDVNYHVLLSKGYAATTNHHAIFLLNGKIYCIMKISGTYRNINTGVTVNDGNWHHVAVTIQRNDKMKLYLDGALKANVDITGDASVDAQDIYGFYLGRSHYGQYFAGSIDEVKIFDKALNDGEVSQLYN
ncbi:MAG: LamG domain-containing protein [Victivallaceae bacterium]